MEACDVNSSGSAPSPIPDAQSEFSTVDEARSSDDSTVRSMADVDSLDHSAESRGVTKIRRLIADQPYFGLDALTLQTGAKRMLVRIDSQGPRHARIDVRSLGNDFRLDAAASRKLLSELLAGGLLHRDDTGGHRATALFREYALACVVAPLSRARARTLIDRASELAARINTSWKRNPHFIQTVAVSGSYMTRRDPLDELSLWLVVRRRPQTQWQRWKPSVSNDDGLRRIGAAMKALSSFVVVRVAADRQRVQRPFTVAFEASDDAMERPLAGLEKLWETSASFSRRLFLR
jgi:hypothetical protein